MGYSRKEPFGVGDYVHLMKRGARGSNIKGELDDAWRTLLMLCHFNDEFEPRNFFRDLSREKIANTMRRPSVWPAKTPIVSVLAFTLLDNHIHLLLREMREGGVEKFIRRLGTGMAMHFNKKYKEKGALFQGPYKSVMVDTDEYLRHLAVYIMVKNVFEMYPNGGLQGALTEFEEAWEWAAKYPYSSLGDYVGVRSSPIIEKDVLGEIFEKPADFKKFAKQTMAMYEEVDGEHIDPVLGDLGLERK